VGYPEIGRLSGEGSSLGSRCAISCQGRRRSPRPPAARQGRITGKSGTGKSHLLKAFALRACEQGLSMRYARCVDLLEDLHAGLADGTYPRRLKAWARPDLLIMTMSGSARSSNVAMNHRRSHPVQPRRSPPRSCLHGRDLEHRAQRLGRFLGDATLTAAILDRLAMHAIRIDIGGASYRQHVAGRRASDRAPAL